MHWVQRQSQRREAAEAEASFLDFTEAHKPAGGKELEEDAMPQLNSLSVLSSPVAKTQRQTLTCVLQSSEQHTNIKKT